MRGNFTKNVFHTPKLLVISFVQYNVMWRLVTPEACFVQRQQCLLSNAFVLVRIAVPSHADKAFALSRVAGEK